MRIETHSFNIFTKGFNDIIDITNQVEDLVIKNNFIEGSVLVFVPGATAGITTIEYEPGLIKDYPQLMERLIPSNKTYNHDSTWHDGNGYAHLRASLQGASFTVPFKDKKLLLGTWQQIILIDFDNRTRKRNVVVQIIGV